MKSCKPHEKQNKKRQNAKSTGKNWKLRVWCSLFHFSHLIWKISNFKNVSRKAFGASFLYWVDFNDWRPVSAKTPDHFLQILICICRIKNMVCLHSIFIQIAIWQEYQTQVYVPQHKKGLYLGIYDANLSWNSIHCNFPPISGLSC